MIAITSYGLIIIAMIYGMVIIAQSISEVKAGSIFAANLILVYMLYQSKNTQTVEILLVRIFHKVGIVFQVIVLGDLDMEGNVQISQL
jgi:hypothetical protein